MSSEQRRSDARDAPRSNRDLEALADDDGTAVFFASGGSEIAVYLRTPVAPLQSEWDFIQFGEASPASELLETRITPRQPGTFCGSFLGAMFYLERVGPPPVATIVAALVPYWLLCLLTGVAPMVWLMRLYTRRRVAGRCPSCGHDLRTAPDQCPECGAPVEAKVK